MGRTGRAGLGRADRLADNITFMGLGLLCVSVCRESVSVWKRGEYVCVNQNWLFAIVTFFALKGRGGVKKVGVRQAEADQKFVLASLGRQALPPSVPKNKATICNQH